MRELLEALEATMDTHVGQECRNQDYHHRKATLCTNLAETGHSFKELRRLRIWPMFKLVNGATIEFVSIQVCGFVDFKVSNCPSNFKVDCKERLQKAVEEASKGQLGLCLNCVKKGKIKTLEGNCQAESLELCMSLL